MQSERRGYEENYAYALTWNARARKNDQREG
jgi:hypothetical protein